MKKVRETFVRTSWMIALTASSIGPRPLRDSGLLACCKGKLSWWDNCSGESCWWKPLLGCGPGYIAEHMAVLGSHKFMHWLNASFLETYRSRWMLVTQQLRSSDLGPLATWGPWDGSWLYHSRCGRPMVLFWWWLTCDTTGLGDPYPLLAIVDLPSQQVEEAHCSILVVANFSSQSNKGIINNIGTELVGGQAQVSDSKMANMLNMAAQVGEVH